MRFGGFGFERQFGFGATLADPEPVEPVVLASSLDLARAGANDAEYALTDQRGTDGMYRLVCTGTPDNFTWIQSVDDISGDYLIEFRTVDMASYGFHAGADPTPAAATSASVNECLIPNAGFGATRMNFRKNGTYGPQNIVYNPVHSVFLERIGTTCNFYHGVHWGLKAFLGTQSAVDGGDRYFWAGTTVPGEWRLRFIAHPGA